MDLTFNKTKQTPKSILPYEPEQPKKSDKGKLSGGKSVQQGIPDAIVKDYSSRIQTIKDYKGFEDFVITELKDGSHFSLVYTLAQKQGVVDMSHMIGLIGEISDKAQKEAALLSVAQNTTAEIDKRMRCSFRIQDPSLKNQAFRAIAEDSSVAVAYRLSILKDINDSTLRDEIYLLIAKEPQLSVDKRIDILEQVKDQNLRDQTLFLIAQEAELNTSKRLDIIKNISSTELKDKLLEAMIEDPSQVRYYQHQIAHFVTDSALKNKLWFLTAQDVNVELWSRLRAIENLTQDSFKQLAWLSIVKDKELKIENRLDALSNITDWGRQEAAYLSLVASPELKFNERLKYLKLIKTTHLKKQAYVALVRDRTLDTNSRLNVISAISDPDIKDQACSAIAVDNECTYHIRYNATHQIQNLKLKDEVLYSMIKDIKIEAYQRLQLAQSISDESLRDTGLSLIAQNPSVQPSIRLAAAASIVGISAKDYSYSSIAQDRRIPLQDRCNAYYFIQSSEALHSAGIALCEDPTINTIPVLYTGFMLKNQHHLVIDSMQASFEGLDEAQMETVRDKKVAATQAVLQYYPSDQEAQMIQYLFENPGPDSPYTLYKIVLAKSQDYFPIERALEDFKQNSQERFCFSVKAFELPSVLDASWENSFSNINFDSFIGVFQKGCQDYREQIQSIQDQNKNKALEQEWLNTCGGPKQAIFRAALNNVDPFSGHGNKIKKIALLIQDLFNKEDYDNAFSAIDNLVYNLKTCEGGQQQAIEATYFSILSSINRVNLSVKDNIELLKIKEKEKVLSALYSIRQNYLLENERVYTNGQWSVQDSPQQVQASFVHNLLHTLKVTAQDIEIGDERLPGNAKNAFNNTHIGLNLNAIAGAEIGLRQPDSHPPYDPNLYAAAKLVKHPNTTKAKIVKAFVNAFCFSNIYNALGKRLWTAVATESKLPYDLFEDDQGETIASLPSSDPLCKGAEAFLENIGVQRSEFSEYFDTKCYYYIDTSFGDIELMPIAINIGFSKQGTAKILQKLDYLEDTLPEFSAFFLKRKILA